MDLLCVGDVMLDVRVEAGALARGGDVHGRVIVQPGGSAANAAVWAAWAGARTGLVGRVGRDVAGRVLGEALAERGVETHLAVDPEAPTGTMLVVLEAGERSMVADRGANARLRPEDLPERIEAGAVLVSGYVLLQEDSRPAALAALDRADATYVAVDAASWPLVEAYGVERFLRDTARADVLLANELEARTLTGREGEAAARAPGARYRIAAVKPGARGPVACADAELEDARWFSREQIARGEALLPPRTSISHRLIAAWFDALAWWRAHPDEALAIMAKYAETPLSDYRVLVNGVRIFTLADNLRAFEEADDFRSLAYTGARTAAFLKEKGLIERIPDVRAILDPSFVRALAAEESGGGAR